MTDYYTCRECHGYILTCGCKSETSPVTQPTTTEPDLTEAMEARDATIGYRDCQIAALKQLVAERDARIAELAGVLDRCAQIVERYNWQQSEKVDDVIHLARRILTKQEPKA